MIYRLTKKIHKFTAFAGALLLIFSAGASDFYVVELGQGEPASVGTMYAFGLYLMIPTAIYLILEYIKESKKIGR